MGSLSSLHYQAQAYASASFPAGGSVATPPITSPTPKRNAFQLPGEETATVSLEPAQTEVCFNQQPSRGKRSLPKRERIERFFALLQRLDPVSNDLLAYQQVWQAMKQIEDEFATDPWDLSKRLEQRGRMYPPLPPEEPFQPVEGFSGVTRMDTIGHSLFIGRNGAMEVQGKDEQSRVPYCQRRNRVRFAKPGANGNGVWTDPINCL
ncbi:MAG: hypothetical protein SFZ03_02185 [Candidatus Melainabacteria bacterium]|nr:hypothetical protein [Candidatus Melainabacteria bacterium]